MSMNLTLCRSIVGGKLRTLKIGDLEFTFQWRGALKSNGIEHLEW